MEKVKKNKLIIGIVILAILLLIGLIYFMFSYRSSNKLTLEENKWIDSNKYNVIDIAMINDIPILGYEGKGLIYDYLNYVTDKTSLQFNIIPYKLDGEINYEYKVDIVKDISSDEFNIYKDSLVLVLKDGKTYNNLKGLPDISVGVLSSDKEELTNYFDSSVKLIAYDTYTDLKNAMSDSKEEGTTDTENKEEDVSVDGIIIPKIIYTKELIENNYKISYCFNDINRYFVLKTTGNSLLNSILKKKFNNWKESKYEENYNSNLLSNYYSFKNISDTDQKKLQSKTYNYGFIDYGIYNHLDGSKISGFNELVLKGFNKFSGASIKYTKFNSISRLIKDFNAQKVDFIIDIANEANYDAGVYKTVGFLDKTLVVVSGISNKVAVNGINSLKDKEVLTIKDSYIEKLLLDNGAKPKSYANFKDMMTDFTSDDLVIMDLENYNYYKTSSLKDSRISYIFNISDKYNYVINNADDNSIFKDIFEFYINYNSANDLISANYEKIAYKNINIVYILVLIIIVLVTYLVLDFSNHVRIMIKKIKKNKKINLTKQEKIKYIDQLTSLKNRAYLNSMIESWDESEVYPQAIIIVDLNNISYINDNYGREEGDKVITEAANILIQNQLQNSEIIRTDGNEFLVYLVGYNEKQIVTYRRKLNKELKSLSHGFGAASGYSIITDAIKTIDDAVNEATLDMKNNKEDIEY